MFNKKKLALFVLSGALLSTTFQTTLAEASTKSVKSPYAVEQKKFSESKKVLEEKKKLEEKRKLEEQRKLEMQRRLEEQKRLQQLELMKQDIYKNTDILMEEVNNLRSNLEEIKNTLVEYDANSDDTLKDDVYKNQLKQWFTIIEVGFGRLDEFNARVNAIRYYTPNVTDMGKLAEYQYKLKTIKEEVTAFENIMEELNFEIDTFYQE